jgi:hypothetical protein
MNDSEQAPNPLSSTDRESKTDPGTEAHLSSGRKDELGNVPFGVADTGSSGSFPVMPPQEASPSEPRESSESRLSTTRSVLTADGQVAELQRLRIER